MITHVGMVYVHKYVSWAVQFHPHGGQSDFVWPSARTPHGIALYVWCLTARRNQEKYPPEIHYRPFFSMTRYSDASMGDANGEGVFVVEADCSTNTFKTIEAVSEPCRPKQIKPESVFFLMVLEFLTS